MSLNNQFADVDKINMIDFRRSCLSQMMPLDVIESDTYANYGIDNIGMDYSVGGEDAPKPTFLTHLLTTVIQDILVRISKAKRCLKRC